MRIGMRQTQRSGHLRDSLPLRFPPLPAFQRKPFRTVASLLNLCKNIQHLQQVHARFVLQGLHQNPTLSSQLIDCYANLGHLSLSQQVFNSIHYPNSVVYNSFLGNLYKVGDFQRTLLVYQEMAVKSVHPDEETYPVILRSCSFVSEAQHGKTIHGQVLKLGFDGYDMVGTALVEMYSKRGDFSGLGDARLVFEDMPHKDRAVWNILISAYSRNGRPKESLELLRCMAQSGIRADLFTALPVLSSIMQLRSVEWGKQIHAQVLRSSLDYQGSVHNSLIDMYFECDHLHYAQKTFDLMRDKTMVSWSLMIKGYVTHDRSLEALSFFSKMKLDGTRGDFVTVINILPACVNVGALEQVKYLHGYSIKLGLDSLSSLRTALFVSYAKCGCIGMARQLFDEGSVNCKDIIAWNSMINAYAKHGDWSQCFALYNLMKHLNLIPDQITFLGLLTACVNSGFVKQGWQCYKEMIETYGIQPSHEHYACMVDLLGRAGHIEEARELIKTMPLKPDARVWGPLLSACRTHSKTDLAEFAAEKLLGLEPKNAGNYILLSNIYAAAGKWEEVAKMRNFLKNRGLKKTPGCSWLEINGRVHEFRVADQSHPRANDIYGILETLEFEIKEAKKKSLEKTVTAIGC